MTIEFDVLFTDLFCNELKPVSCSGGSYFIPSKKVKSKSSLEIFLDQANSMSGLTGLPAAQAALKVARQMKGIRGNAKTLAALCSAVTSAVSASSPHNPRRFVDAVNQVTAVTKAGKFGELRSAASKMLQVFDEFLDVAVIYDSVVERALGTGKDFAKYVREFNYQLNQPHIKNGGSLITIHQFFNDPLVMAKISAAGIPANLNNFIVRRTFDRVLWLGQAAKEQSGSWVFGLCPKRIVSNSLPGICPKIVFKGLPGLCSTKIASSDLPDPYPTQIDESSVLPRCQRDIDQKNCSQC